MLAHHKEMCSAKAAKPALTLKGLAMLMDYFQWGPPTPEACNGYIHHVGINLCAVMPL
jgi:hypothetical protein